MFGFARKCCPSRMLAVATSENCAYDARQQQKTMNRTAGNRSLRIYFSRMSWFLTPYFLTHLHLGPGFIAASLPDSIFWHTVTTQNLQLEQIMSAKILLPSTASNSPISMNQRKPTLAAWLCAVLIATVLLPRSFGQSAASIGIDPLPQDTGVSGLKQEIRKLETTGRLLQVVAHPDDEDGGMLTLEARGKGVSTILMTLTRGEGGQNKVGSSLFDVLGVLRALELTASDRYYGVEQRFSHVADFGFSKSPEEAFQKWGGHDTALSDMVRVIRTFRPDVLVARF